MSLSHINPTQTEAWSQLKAHYDQTKSIHLKDQFTEDKNRASKFSINWKNFFIDFSKNRINDKTIKLLLQLAEETHLKEAITKYFQGDIINKTEGRAVLHTALRASETDSVKVNDINIINEVHRIKGQVKTFTNSIISGQAKGYTNKAFTDVVNIGIGGSDLGPAMVTEALKYYKNHLNIHFVNNVDGDHVQEVLRHLNPETTLFIIVSKSFTTQETLTNATTIKDWFLEYGTLADIAKHFVAVSTNTDKASEFGISSDNVFPMWDWVGGRFSLWSAVGISIALGVGYDNFEALLEGANEMDTHFKNEDFGSNAPVILALLSIWYNNFYMAETEAIIPYTQYLSRFPAYLQQSIMESNGKSVDRNGDHITYQTGNIVWGEPGTNSQHAFFQLIHQGTKIIPCDFIGFKKALYGNTNHHDKLMANFFAQTEALMNGKTKEQVKSELQASDLSEEQVSMLLPYKIFDGNNPTTTILIDSLTPQNLGALISLYEHKIFVQGVIWNVFSYDQWGVELGKQLAGQILTDLKQADMSQHDSSTNQLLTQYKNQL